MIQSPSVMIGDVPLYGDLILAPMIGYTDVPFRVICREMGAALSYVPYVADKAVIQKSKRKIPLVDFAASERPVALQLMGREEESLLQACQRLLALEPDLFDVNLGCPSKRVVAGGRGAALLREPDQVAGIVRRLATELTVPVTAKIRLGWDDETRNHVEIARLLEDAGVAAICVHGRTKEQMYRGQADWDAIAEVRQAVDVPVLANGDVRCVADIEAIKIATGCDLVVIGRGAVGNPWLFARRDLAQVTGEERLQMIRRHLAEMQAYYGQSKGVVLFRKHVVRYVATAHGAGALRSRLVACETAEQLLGVLDQQFRVEPAAL